MDHAAVRGAENRPGAAMHGLAPLRPDDALLSDRQPPYDQRHQQRVFGAGTKYSAAARSRPPQGLYGRTGAFADGAQRGLELQAGAFRQYGHQRGRTGAQR